MVAPPVKTSSQILVAVKVKTFSNQGLEDFDSSRHSPKLLLSSKIEEYMVRIGESNEFCFNIIVQLLTKGKVRVDFRDTTERLQLVNKEDIMSRPNAVKVFDHWVEENRTQPMTSEKTQRIVLEQPRIHLPRSK